MRHSKREADKQFTPTSKEKKKNNKKRKEN